MSKDYICQEYMGEEKEEKEENLMDERTSDKDESEDESNQPPLKKLKSGVLTYSSFTEEDLHSFVARVSLEQRKAVQQCLSSEEGKVIGILTKMQDDRSNAIHRRFNGLNKQIWNKFELMEEKLTELDKLISKLDGMGKFTYAWCKSAGEAGIFKLKQR